ncbi:hypothetical protein V8C26DRAFT_133136 [Trichoderma gracile]
MVRSTASRGASQGPRLVSTVDAPCLFSHLKSHPRWAHPQAGNVSPHGKPPLSCLGSSLLFRHARPLPERTAFLSLAVTFRLVQHEADERKKTRVTKKRSFKGWKQRFVIQVWFGRHTLINCSVL